MTANVKSRPLSKVQRQESCTGLMWKLPVHEAHCASRTDEPKCIHLVTLVDKRQKWQLPSIYHEIEDKKLNDVLMLWPDPPPQTFDPESILDS